MSTFQFNGELILRPFGDVVQLEGMEDDQPLDLKSLLGLPIYDALEIEAGSYTLYNPDGSTQTVDFDGMILDKGIINLSQRKNIVKTRVAGRDGTVKEYIGLDDYDVYFYGFITDPGIKFPIEELRILEGILNAPTALRVSSRVLDLFGIDSIVVQAYNLNPDPGFNNRQPITIRALSDTPINLDLSQTTEL